MHFIGNYIRIDIFDIPEMKGQIRAKIRIKNAGISMLISFTLSNFLSFNAAESISLKAGAVRTKKEHLNVVEKPPLELLKFSAIYGANGAGKSNLVKAMYLLRTFVRTGRLLHGAADSWCKIDAKNKERPSSFEIEFFLDGAIFVYGIEVTLSAGKIEREWLFRRNVNKKVFLFKKEQRDSPCVLGKDFERIENVKALATVFAQSSAPFLFNINNNTQALFATTPQVQVLRNVHQWFERGIEITFPDRPLSETTLLTDTDSIREFERLLLYFGTGIDGIKSVEVTLSKVMETLNIFERASLQAQIEVARQFHNRHNKEIWSAAVRNRNNVYTVKIGDDGNVQTRELKFVHNYADQGVAFERGDESDGTARLFDLLEVLVSKQSKTYVIDEISRCLHPSLTINFIEKYLSLARERQVQLLVTTHEFRLMDMKKMRRDEFWVCERRNDFSSKIRSLEESKIRIDKSLSDASETPELGGVELIESRDRRR